MCLGAQFYINLQQVTSAFVSEDVLGEQINLYPIEKIGEVQLSCEIGGFEISKKTNFIITIITNTDVFIVRPYFEEMGEGALKISTRS